MIEVKNVFDDDFFLRGLFSVEGDGRCCMVQPVKRSRGGGGSVDLFRRFRVAPVLYLMPILVVCRYAGMITYILSTWMVFSYACGQDDDTAGWILIWTVCRRSRLDF
jgi:hypothetical protein